MNTQTLDITITRKAIKHLYIRVRSPGGAVEVSAPRWMRDSAVHAAVKERYEWIRQQQQDIAARPAAKPHAFEHGEIHELWGLPYPLEILPHSGRSRVQCTQDALRVYTRKETTQEKIRRLLDAFYRAQLKIRIGELLPRWEQTIGVQCKEWRVRQMQTRWGSCNIPAKRIWLNLELAKKPPECLECVLVHELVHFLERGHNARFYGLMDQFLPHWRESDQLLNRQG